MTRPSVLLSVLGLILTIAAVACSRPSRENAGVITPGPVLTAPDAIRQFDFASSDAIRAASQFTNSTPDFQATIYADVTGDGQEEAIIPFSSGGSQGYVLYHVYRINRSVPDLILTRNADRTNPNGIRMTVVNGVLTETSGVFANEDPLCCPSQLRQVTFKWDGTKLQIASENVVPNPNAAKS